MGSEQLQAFRHTDTAGQNFLNQVTNTLSLAARTYTLLLKVAQMIAGLSGSESIAVSHLTSGNPISFSGSLKDYFGIMKVLLSCHSLRLVMSSVL